MTTTMTRQEHLAWAKERALEYVDAGDMLGAISSMISDLGKHPETATGVYTVALIAPFHGTPQAVRTWVEGCN